MTNKIIKKKMGFSLIELIVVITIIAVITVIGTVNYGQTNRKARDSRRMADIEKIRIALEMARQIGSTYPSTVNYDAGYLVNNKYINGSLPKDPKTGNDYFYRGLTSYTYAIGTSMEDLGSTNNVSTGCVICNYGVLSP